MAKETIVGIEEIERRLFERNHTSEIVDRNIDLEEK